MKFLVLLSLAVATLGFSPSRITPLRRSDTSLAAASGLHKSQSSAVQVSTEPVADRPVSKSQRAAMKDVMIDPDYTLAISVAALCPLIIAYHPTYYADGSLSLIGVCGGLFHLLFAALLWVQTRRVRCVFEKDAFEFYNLKGRELDMLTRKPDNYVSGTINRWRYDKIINWGFFPSVEFPVIVYFKETETPEEQWNKWFAAFDSYNRGQPHFFPGICSVKQWKEQMVARGVKRKPVPTLESTRNAYKK